MTFNPFQENTYVLADETNECVIIDPGCYHSEERDHLKNFIAEENLKPVKVVNTHCHIDHVFGNYFCTKEWNLELYCHELDKQTLDVVPRVAEVYGIPGYQISPDPDHYITENDKLTFGNSSMDIIFTPGHAPGHVVFYSPEDKFVINGDVLFKGSIGRYDFPTSSLEDLKDSIINKMFELPEDTLVYTGHGPETTIGEEKHTSIIHQL